MKKCILFLFLLSYLSADAQLFQCISDDLFFKHQTGPNRFGVIKDKAIPSNFDDICGNHIQFFAYLPDDYFMPVCEEDNYGEFRLLMEVTVTDNSFDAEVCFNEEQSQLFRFIRGFTQTSVTPTFYPDGSPNGNRYCGRINFSQFSNSDKICVEVGMKYKSQRIGISQFTNGLGFDITNITDGSLCYSEEFSLSNLATERESNAIPAVPFPSGVSSLSSLNIQGQNGPWYIPANSELIIDANNTTIIGREIFLGKDSKITIPDNTSTTIFNDINLRRCDDRYDGVVIEGDNFISNNSSYTGGDEILQIADGVIADVSGSTFDDANICIKTTDNVSLILFANNFSNANFGLSSTGNLNVQTFRNNIFQDLQTAGVQITNSTGAASQGPAVNLAASLGNENLFTNCRTAIIGENASMNIKYNSVTDCTFGLDLNEVTGTDIQYNSIDDTNLAINAKESVFRALNNNIGLSTIVNSAFNIRRSPNVLLQDNVMYVKSAGLRSGASSVEMLNNDIFMLEQSSGTWTRAVSSIVSNDNISSNYFDTDKQSVAIENMLSPGSEITNNHFDIFQNNKNAILLRSTTDVDVQRNDLSSSNNGVLANRGITLRNAGNNLLECNNIKASWQAIDIDANADFQELLTNTLDASNLAIEINSILGPQRFHSNEFINESEIAALGIAADPQNIERSLFTVDPNVNNIHEPGDWDPSELVDIAFDQNNDSENCTTPIGPLVTPINFDPTVISLDPDDVCATVSWLESIKSSNYRKYFINLQHLYRYYLLKQPVSNWPSCLSAKWTANIDCGVKDFTTVEVAIFNELNNKNQSLNELKTKETERRYEEDYGDGASSQLLGEISNINSVVKNSLASTLSTSRTTINAASCTEEIAIIWKEIFTVVIDYIEYDSITTAQSNSLHLIATRCPQTYGDPVEWARMILSQEEQTSYDETVNCNGPQLRPIAEESVEKASNSLVTIAPNPTDDVLRINIENEVSNLRYTIYNSSGQQLLQNDNREVNQLTVNTSILTEGIYYIYIEMDDKVITKRFIKL